MQLLSDVQWVPPTDDTARDPGCVWGLKEEAGQEEGRADRQTDREPLALRVLRKTVDSKSRFQRHNQNAGFP